MKITIFAAGSRGDIQPCIVLARGLQDAGYSVRLAAPQDFAAFIQGHGVNFWPLRGDIQQIMASDTARNFMERGGGNLIQSVRTMRAMIAPVIMQLVEDAAAACQDADALICLGVFSAFGQAIAEAYHIPLMHLEPAPLLPTRAFAAPAWPVQRNWGGLHNYFSGVAMLQTIWLWYRPFVKQFRQRLGLAKPSFASFLRVLRSTPMISAYSPAVIPHPCDWPDNVHITGYLFLDAEPEWQPPPALQAFLEAGDPPVYIGFGSMAGRDPEQLAGLVLAALAKSGQRGVLMTGWGALHAQTVPDDVFVLESAPHSWLFPRMAAVVHHGGAGTTAEGLRAGVPTVIVPFAFDQPFWGARIQERALGPAPLARKQLTVDRLAHAITMAVTDQDMQQRARSTSAAIRAEDGIGNAVKAIESYLDAATFGKDL